MTSSFRFSKKLIDALPPQLADAKSREAEYSDSDATGLKLLVNKVGKKVFYYRYSYEGQKKGLKIGDYPAMEVAEARQIALAYRAGLNRGADPQQAMLPAQSKHPRLKEFVLNDYLPHARSNKRSANDDESKFRLHLLPRFGLLELNEIKPHEVQKYHNEIKSTHCAATANRHLALLKRVLNLAILWGLADSNPAKGIRMHQEDNQRQRYLTPDEIKRLLAAIDLESNQAAANVIRLLLLTGTRKQEALEAKWSDIDLAKGSWFLPKTKAGKGRFVILNTLALTLLRTITPHPSNPYVFPGRVASQPLNNPMKAFRRILQQANIESFRIHDLRHSYASLAISNGASLYEVQMLLGHANSTTTLRYAHLTDDRLRQASGNVADAIGRATQ